MSRIRIKIHFQKLAQKIKEEAAISYKSKKIKIHLILMKMK